MELCKNNASREYRGDSFSDENMRWQRSMYLKSEERMESIFKDIVESEDIDSSKLAYIVCNTKNKDVFMKALNHPRVIIDWSEVTCQLDDVTIVNKEFWVEELKKQFDEMMIVKDSLGRNLFLSTCGNLMRYEFMLNEVFLNYIMDYIIKNFDDEFLISLIKNVESDDFLYLLALINNIRFHPNSSASTSSKGDHFLDKMYAISSLTEVNGKDFLTELKRIRKFNCKEGNYQGFTVSLLKNMLQFKYDKNALEDDYNLKGVLEFIYAESTTDDIMKKVLLDKIDFFCTIKEENGRRVVCVDKRLDVLFEAIVNDERFEQKELPFELLNKMFNYSKNNNVLVKCWIKSGSKIFREVILRRVLEDNEMGIIDLYHPNVPNDIFIEIANKSNSALILGYILWNDTIVDFPLECIDIIWRRKDEFPDDEKSRDRSRDTIYNYMCKCKYATKDKLLDSLKNLKAPLLKYCASIILNSNFDVECWNELQYLILCGRFEIDDYYKSFLEEGNLEKIVQDPVGQANMYSKEKLNWWQMVALDMKISYKIMCFIKYYESIPEESVIQFLSQFGDKSREYIEAYYRLLSFIPSKEYGDTPRK